jgi:hypothetical protein
VATGTINSVACSPAAFSAITPDEVTGPGLGE